MTKGRDADNWWADSLRDTSREWPQARAAATWWAGVLRNPLGVPYSSNPLSSSLRAETAFQRRPTPAQLASFERYLTARIDGWCRRTFPFPLVIRTDYQGDHGYEPPEVLLTAAAIAGFYPELPDKTAMQITPARVDVSVVDGILRQTIWRDEQPNAEEEATSWYLETLNLIAKHLHKRRQQTGRRSQP